MKVSYDVGVVRVRVLLGLGLGAKCIMEEEANSGKLSDQSEVLLHCSVDNLDSESFMGIEIEALFLCLHHMLLNPPCCLSRSIWTPVVVGPPVQILQKYLDPL